MGNIIRRSVSAFLVLGMVFHTFASVIPALAAGPNLILNPSFEVAEVADPTLPEHWVRGGFGANDAVLSYPVAGMVSGSAASITIATYTDGDAKWVFAHVPVAPGHPYVYTSKYLSEAPTQLIAEFKDASNATSYAGFFVVAPSVDLATWTDLSATFTPPAGTVSMTVFHSLQSVGSLTIDNTSLVEELPFAPFAKGRVSLTFDDGFVSQFMNAKPILDAANMKGTFYLISHTIPGISIPNASVETVDSGDPAKPAHWQSTGGADATFVYPVAGATGGSAVETTSTADGTNAGWYFSPITVLADQVYAYTSDYKSTADTTVVAQVTTVGGSVLEAEVVDVNGVLQGTTSLALSSSADVWTRVSTYFDIPADAKTVTVLHRLQGTGTLAIDNPTLGVVTRMTKAQVLALQAEGHELGGHTQTHPDLIILSIPDVTTEISGDRAQMLAGGATPVLSFSYPYSSFNDAVQQIVEDAGFTSARTVFDGYNGTDTNPFALFAKSVDATTTLAEVESWVDQAEADKSWLILVFHDVVADLAGHPFGTTPTTFQGIVDHVASSDVDVVTMSNVVVVPPTSVSLQVNTIVDNAAGGSAAPADFSVRVEHGAIQVLGSPQAGSASGVTFTGLALGNHIVSQTGPANYTTVLSGDCDVNGNVDLTSGAPKTCIITNTFVAPVNNSGGGSGGTTGGNSGGGGTYIPVPLIINTTGTPTTTPPASGQVLGEQDSSVPATGSAPDAPVANENTSLVTPPLTTSPQTNEPASAESTDINSSESVDAVNNDEEPAPVDESVMSAPAPTEASADQAEEESGTSPWIIVLVLVILGILGWWFTRRYASPQAPR